MKQEVFRRTRVVLVTPSAWAAAEVRASGMFPTHTVRCIPHAIDTRTFVPIAKPLARAQFGLPPEAAVVLYMAHDVREPRKGAVYARAALASLATRWAEERPLAVLIIGKGAERWELPPLVHQVVVDRIHDDQRIAAAYSAADVFLLPSLAETFGLVFVESMACGTPCVAFDTSAVPEVVRHSETGFLAPVRETNALAHALALLLENRALHSRFAARGRAIVLEEYTPERHSDRFLALYRELLDGDAPSRTKEGGASRV
jgi:glycosyltransferase involved in cell wall biosynthesis